MIISVANPIYDAVFKYLMEDNRVAKTILSALLKQEVAEVDMRKHEYTNGTRDKISMFRIDFGAKVRQDDGSPKLVLIELQKTWLETETLRFRQYLGAQYCKKENIVDDRSGGHALPMVAVYILGHRVGNITAPIIYVSHKTYDYDGNVLECEEPNPFVESLTHDSIIVQIPLLHGRVNNRLEKVLSVFDQTNATKANPQTIEVNEEFYAGDDDMEYILKRLLSAASNPDVRQDMNVEDEFFKAIEDRDTAILARDKRIEEQSIRIQAQSAQLDAQSERLQAQNEQLSAQSAQLDAQSAQLSAQNMLIANAVNGMLEKGMAISDVAAMLGLSEEDVKGYTSSAHHDE